MNFGRMFACGKQLCKLNAVSVPRVSDSHKYHNLSRLSFSYPHFRIVSRLRSDCVVLRNICRFRYSFIYSKKINSVINSKLSTLNGESRGLEGSSSQNLDNEVPLTKAQAAELVLRLTEEERKFLFAALNEYESSQIKTEYEGQLAATRWRSKFGRPSKLPTLGDVDPTGSYCHLTEDWLKKKYAEKVPTPTMQQLIRVATFNAVPFIGFGFLDNFIMIMAGDYIDETVGSIVTLSTMAAAALGNTISDVMGIGSAWYVEYAASKVGLKAPNLSPIQLDMKPARRSANLGRVTGIIIGCLLGMVPLLFMKKEEKAVDRGVHEG